VAFFYAFNVVGRMQEKSFDDLIAAMDEDIWRRMRDAVATGKWANGELLSDRQQALSLQAIIAWEVRNGVAEEQRTGYVPMKQTPSPASAAGADQPVGWREPREQSGE